jgi:hypothetical protein
MVDREESHMMLFGLGKAAVTTLPTFPSQHYQNLTTYMFNGSSNVSSGIPQFGKVIYELLYTANDAFALSYLVFFATPFIMIVISTSSVKSAGILGMLCYGFVFLFIPTDAQVFAVIGMAMAAIVTIYGVFKP